MGRLDTVTPAVHERCEPTAVQPADTCSGWHMKSYPCGLPSIKTTSAQLGGGKVEERYIILLQTCGLPVSSAVLAAARGGCAVGRGIARAHAGGHPLRQLALRRAAAVARHGLIAACKKPCYITSCWRTPSRAAGPAPGCRRRSPCPDSGMTNPVIYFLPAIFKPGIPRCWRAPTLASHEQPCERLHCSLGPSWQENLIKSVQAHTLGPAC